jgi:hypothetical protein
MPNLEPTLANLLDRAMTDRLSDVFTSEVGTVVAWHESGNTADIQLAARRPVPTSNGEITYEQPPVLPSVPVVAFGNSRSYVQVALESGDSVLLIFTGRSPAEFLAGSDDSNPADLARHSLSNAFAIPIVRPGTAAAGPGKLALHADVKALHDLLKLWTPVPGDGGAALKTAAAAMVLTGGTKGVKGL